MMSMEKGEVMRKLTNQPEPVPAKLVLAKAGSRGQTDSPHEIKPVGYEIISRGKRTNRLTVQRTNGKRR